jgi:hypothetical protein
MDLRRILRDLDGAGRSFLEGDKPRLDDEADGYELTVSARRFTQATRKVVDEKLTFSAALLRAGELDEAQKILAEVEHDVRNEEAALLEKVNEVSAKRAVTRTTMTRMRLVRMLATAMVGAGLLGVSAMGMAVAGMFEEQQGKGRHAKKAERVARVAQADMKQGSKKVIGGMKVTLSRKDLDTFRRLTSGTVDAQILEKFLVSDLELPPAVVNETIAEVLDIEPVLKEVTDAVDTTTAATDAVVAEVVTAPKKKIERAKEEAASEPADESSEPGNETTEEPPAEESPEPEAKQDDEDAEDGSGDGDGQKTGIPGVEDL